MLQNLLYKISGPSSLRIFQVYNIIHKILEWKLLIHVLLFLLMYFSLIPDNVILLDDGPLDSINEFRGRSVIKEFSSRNVEHIPHPAHYSEETYRNVPELNSRSVYELDSAPVYELDNGNTNYELWDRTSPPKLYSTRYLSSISSRVNSN